MRTRNAVSDAQVNLLEPPPLPPDRAPVDWSEYQRSIFEFGRASRRNGIVVARAGSGKTRTLVELLHHVPDKKPLLCAFNAIIAEELHSRCPHVEARTMHSLGLSALRTHWGIKDVHPVSTKERQTLDSHLPSWVEREHRGDIQRLVRMAKASLAWTDKELDTVARSFKIFIPWETYRQEGRLPPGAKDSEMFRWVRGCLEEACKPSPEISFDDMIYVPAKTGMVVATADTLLVDEAQDLTPAQVSMLRLMMAPRGGRVIGVGDPRQAIYGFRGADKYAISHIKNLFDTFEMSLPITYRCARKIVEIARVVVDDFEPAPWAKEGIVRALPVDQLVDDLQPGDMVISRTNAPMIGLCLRTLLAGKPCYIQGRDLGNGLVRIVTDSKTSSIPDFARWLHDWAQHESHRLSAANLESQTETLQDKIDTLVALCEGLRTTKQLVDRIKALFGKGPTNRIRYSSTHRAKGLEANRVHMLEWTYRPEFSEEEENLWYVAVTRARDELVFVQK